MPEATVADVVRERKRTKKIRRKEKAGKAASPKMENDLRSTELPEKVAPRKKKCEPAETVASLSAAEPSDLARSVPMLFNVHDIKRRGTRVFVLF